MHIIVYDIFYLLLKYCCGIYILKILLNTFKIN